VRVAKSSRNSYKISGLACKPDFVRRAPRPDFHPDGFARNAATIPLGLGSLRGSSSLPEGRSASLFRAKRIRAGPALPSYLALLHAGFSVPWMLPSRRWALTPPFHPCQCADKKQQALGFSEGLPPRCNRRRRFVFCGTFRGRTPGIRLRVSRLAQPPGVTRRVALRRCLFRVHDDGVRTFLPSASLARSEPAITQLTRRVQYTPPA